MLVKTNAALMKGMEAVPITIETDVSSGLPSYQIVGQPDLSIKESRERLRLSILHSGYAYPKGKITVNMVPAEIPKRGSHFDLAIAVGILCASGQIEDIDRKILQQSCFLGELSLDGSVNRIKGVLPMAAAMKERGIVTVFVPKENIQEALLVKGMQFFEISNLYQVVDHLCGRKVLPVAERNPKIFCHKTIKEKKKDFSQVCGQEGAKRAVMIAVAGGHGLLMVGSPSTGKTMLAERIPSIMPPLDYEDILKTTAIYSVSGLLDESLPYIIMPPFRQPHHKLTVAGLLGGGKVPKPGEITLANKGVLFLDEAGEFAPELLDNLRVPLEKKEITLIRDNQQYTYPADFLLIAASNPCPCGYLGDSIHSCKCSPAEIHRYQKRFSGPMMERIDIHIHLTAVAYEELTGMDSMSSTEMGKKILAARELQKKRYEGTDISLNHQLDERHLEIYAPLSQEGSQLLKKAYEQMKLNPRTLQKVRKLARTIADLEGCDQIELIHLTEALQYREKSHDR